MEVLVKLEADADWTAISSSFKAEMEAGLKADPSSPASPASAPTGPQPPKPSCLRMIPTFATRPTGYEEGQAFALDLGGTNFRVASVVLHGGEEQGKLGTAALTQATITSVAMQGGDVELFDFIADVVRGFLEEHRTDEHSASGKQMRLGFTFSFPVAQTAIDAGTLLHWTKGFSTANVVGRDVVQLLKAALQRRSVAADVRCLVSDTVATFAAGAFVDQNCAIGVILGTGTNACYVEHDIPKLVDPDNIHGVAQRGMVINMEWGAFGDHGHMGLPVTEVDDELDRRSVNPTKQRFEKLISGMYLGDIVKLTLHKLADEGAFPKFGTEFSFESKDIRTFIDDETDDLAKIGQVAHSKWNLTLSLEERQLARRVCLATLDRAAKLTAVAIGTVATRVASQQCGQVVGVAIDGSVYEGQPRFQAVLKSTLSKLFPDISVDLRLVKDGSSVGAAVLAARGCHLGKL